MSRIVVTGGAGFLGSSLCERLLADGHRVVAIDDFSRGTSANLSEAIKNGNFEFIEGNACDPTPYLAALERLEAVDTVYHMAAINGTKLFHEQARRVIDININATLMSLQMAESWDARYVLASSPEALGITEEMPLSHTSFSRFPPAFLHQRFAYGASKYLDEVMVHHAVGQGMDARIVRPFNGYGPRLIGTDEGQVVAMMFNAVLNSESIKVHGDGQQTRSFTHVDDLVDGFVRAGTLDESHATGEPLAGLTFNLATDEEITILDLAQHVNEIVGSLAVELTLGGGYHGDSRRRSGDTSPAVTHLGWSPSVTIDEGLRCVWKALRSQP